MADSNSPSYAKIGFTVFIGILAVIGTLIYLGGVRGGDDLVYAETYYVTSVSGLSVGSPVNFRGVKLGEVVDIGFVGDRYEVTGTDNQLVYVKMSFPRRNLSAYVDEGYTPEALLAYMVENASLRATVTASGITGLSRIEIDVRRDVPPMVISWTPHTTYIPPAVSLLDSFSDSATKVMNQINRMDISTAWSNISASVQALAQMTAGAQNLMETRQADLEKLSGDLSAILSSLREFADEVRDNPSLLIRERRVTPLPETAR